MKYLKLYILSSYAYPELKLVKFHIYFISSIILHVLLRIRLLSLFSGHAIDIDWCFESLVHHLLCFISRAL